MINGPAATSVRRRRVSGADPKRPTAGKTARYSDRGDEPGSRDELATYTGLDTLHDVEGEIA